MKTPHENISEELLARYFAKTASADEREQVENWLAASPAHAQEFAGYQLIWNHAGASERQFSVDTNAAWNKVRKQMDARPTIPLQRQKKNNTARKLKPAMWVAAVVALLMMAFGWFFLQTQKTPQTITIATANNTLEQLLPDGSKVFLNYNSSITFPEHFDGDTRSVTLTGEAFFDIERDTLHPFTVDAEGTKIQVLGTSFNVKAYNGKPVRVDVESGKVAVSNASRKVNLIKGESAEVAADTILSLRANANIMGYRTQVYDFNATSLSDVVSSIRDGYHVDVRLSNDQIAQCRLTIRFEKEPVDATLAVIAETMNLGLRKEGKVYWLDGNGCE